MIIVYNFKGGVYLNPISSAPSTHFNDCIIQDCNNLSNDFTLTSNHFNLIIIEKGHGTSFINDQQFTLIAPMIICINESEQFTVLEGEGIALKIISFHPSTINSNFTFENVRSFDHSFSPDDIKLAIHLSIFHKRYDNYIGQVGASELALKHIYKLIEQLSHIYTYTPYNKNILLDIVIYIERLIKINMLLSEKIIADTSLEIKDVLLYLHHNYKKKITIPTLSTHFHVNRTTLSDRFLEATGETIITYLNKQRVNTGCILLRDTNLSIAEIAQEIGFNDTAYFAKTFKQYTHHTPSGYRERYLSLCQSDKSH